MKISQKQKDLLFKCIHDEILDLKMSLCRANGTCLYHTNKKIDEKISFLDNSIWKRIKKELNIR